jgi:hypothetical protein
VRFLLFVGDYYYPEGGWRDFMGAHPTLEAAKDAVSGGEFRWDWWHVVDVSVGGIVASGSERRKHL